MRYYYVDIVETTITPVLIEVPDNVTEEQLKEDASLGLLTDYKIVEEYNSKETVEIDAILKGEKNGND